MSTLTLATGIEQLGLHVPAMAAEQLAGYLALLHKWNATYNLTAIRDPQRMLTHHLLDSLAVLPVLEAWHDEKSALARRHGAEPQALRLVDVGSGAGLPGLLLAMVRPAWSIVSVEAVAKKAAFQRQALIELAIGNVEVVGERIERLALHGCDGVISRAFASLADFVALAGHLAPVLWAMKGALPQAELAALPAGWQLAATTRLTIPGLDAERHLLRLEKI